MASEGLGIAVIPTSIVESELARPARIAFDRSQNSAADVLGKLARFVAR
jgi:DNA-binding transcriptional LysR family regulator